MASFLPSVRHLPAGVLLYGKDTQLVKTRQWILEKEGLRLHTALTLADLDRIARQQCITLFLLCDSLAPVERTQALFLLHARWPDTKRLVLLASNLPFDLDPPEVVFPAMEGPHKLVETIHDLIASGPPAPL